jgi:hypothetical protein
MNDTAIATATAEKKIPKGDLTLVLLTRTADLASGAPGEKHEKKDATIEHIAKAKISWFTGESLES